MIVDVKKEHKKRQRSQEQQNFFNLRYDSFCSFCKFFGLQEKVGRMASGLIKTNKVEPEQIEETKNFQFGREKMSLET